MKLYVAISMISFEFCFTDFIMLQVDFQEFRKPDKKWVL